MLEGGGSGMNTNTNRGKRHCSFFHVQLIGILISFFLLLSLGSSSPTSNCGGIGLDSSDPLLPTSYGLTNGSGSPNGIKEESNGADGESGVVKANKGMILRKSVDYIRYGFLIFF